MQLLSNVTTEINAAMVEMASGTTQITQAIEEVNDASSENREGLMRVHQDVAKFKI